MRHQGEQLEEIPNAPRVACSVGQVAKIYSHAQLKKLEHGEYVVVLTVGSQTRVIVGKRATVFLQYPIMVQRVV